jgi:hypothetical protein
LHADAEVNYCASAKTQQKKKNSHTESSYRKILYAANVYDIDFSFTLTTSSCYPVSLHTELIKKYLNKIFCRAA